ncbi:MAG: HD domain-containing protein [Verrucomicrobiota bacterium]
MNAAELLDRQRSADFPARLIEHHRIVSEVASSLAIALNAIGLKIDAERAELMASIHDVGKSVATDELSGAGSTHEEIGAAVAEGFGLPSSISKICRSHSAATPEGMDLEEIVVRLADKLWKGKRDTEFEQRAVASFAESLEREDWEVFMEADKIFEAIAESGHQRLEATRA